MEPTGNRSEAERKPKKPRESQRGPKRNRKETKGNPKETEGNQCEAKRKQKRNQMKPMGGQTEARRKPTKPKGTQREPTRNQMAPKGSQRTREQITERGAKGATGCQTGARTEPTGSPTSDLYYCIRGPSVGFTTVSAAQKLILLLYPRLFFWCVLVCKSPYNKHIYYCIRGPTFRLYYCIRGPKGGFTTVSAARYHCIRGQNAPH